MGEGQEQHIKGAQIDFFSIVYLFCFLETFEDFGITRKFIFFSPWQILQLRSTAGKKKERKKEEEEREKGSSFPGNFVILREILFF